MLVRREIAYLLGQFEKIVSNRARPFAENAIKTGDIETRFFKKSMQPTL